MNAKSLIAAAALTAMSSMVFAQEATSDAWMDAAATKSRTQVQAELAQARKDGTIKAWSAGYIEKTQAVKSREQVRNEVAMARASGELAALNSEVNSFQREPAPVMAKAR